MTKKLVSLLMIMALCFGLTMTASAHDVPQERDDCSIEVQVRYGGEPVNGGTLTAIKVAYVDEDDGNYFFSRVMDDVLVEDIASADAVTLMQAFYSDNKESFAFATTTAAVEVGIAKFADLSTGLYLIVQEQTSPGYSKLNAFLVSVPYVADGEYVYDVTATIKSELERVPETTEAPEPPPGEQLPQTGQMNWPVPVLCAGGLVLFAFGWFLRFGRKKDMYEK